LLDAYKVGMYGGSSETGDWELARAAAAEHDLLLAGGLTPENVAEAILRVCPWGVDVASGVERSRGEKDMNRIAAFIHAARQASQILRQGSDV
jgi:phosphoribosylanthranilate isomerase